MQNATKVRSPRGAPCSEPSGNEQIELFKGELYYAHDIMLAEDGACPWCGEEKA